MRGLCAFSILIVLCTNSCADEAVWKAGVAKAVITPEQPLWMAGYGNRDHPAEGKVHDLVDSRAGAAGPAVVTPASF